MEGQNPTEANPRKHAEGRGEVLTRKKTQGISSARPSEEEKRLAPEVGRER